MSTLHVHHLWGCAPTPLAHYLKALGILRLVAEQKDPGVRGWWQDEHFCLLTCLDTNELERFFLEDYAPTALVAPWNRGSGFFTANDRGLGPIEESTAPRLAKFREGVRAARTQDPRLNRADQAVRALKDRTKAKTGMSAREKTAARDLKNDPKFKKELADAERHFKALKSDLFGPALRSWRGTHRSWMDAAVVILDNGEAKFPSLLGTGGSDGRLDFTNNAMQRIGELFDLADPAAKPRAEAPELLGDALWGTASNKFSTAAVGQFLPGSAGGANMTTGPDGSSLVNPWDFVLMMEGAICLGARATKRLDPRAMLDASAPFSIRAHGAGVATRGGEKNERGEQWMPLWSRPTGVHELLAMLGEARMQLGRRVAHRPVDAARAISRLGVARGLTGFVRYGYLVRNGQSNMAVPIGRIDVAERPQSRLIDDLAPWLDRLQRRVRDKHAPARLIQAEGRLADAVFAALTQGAAPERWQAVLLAAVAIEAIQAAGTAFEAGPIPPLAPEWVRATDDGSPEWRLARTLGSAAGDYRDWGPVDGVRSHWLPLEPDGRRFRVSDKRLVRDPRVVVSGRDAVADCGALVERRLVEAAQKGERHLPMIAARGCEADPSDLAALLADRVDADRVMTLARAFMAVRWHQWVPPQGRAARSGGYTITGRNRITERPMWPEEAWLAIRLAALPGPIEKDRDIPVDPAIVRRLRSGDGAGALENALRRLRTAGLRPPLRGAVSSPAVARLWAAALAFPISWAQSQKFARSFGSTNSQETR